MSDAAPAVRRVAIVTGAASGIGRATARRLALDGAAVLAVDHDEPGLASAVADIAEAGGAVAAHVADLAGPAIGPGIVEDAVARWGRLDTVAHVAGIAQFGPAESIGVDEFDRVVAVNLRAPLLLTQAALSELRRSRGSVVAVSSVAGLQGWPYAAAYAASKGGLVTLMRTIAIENGPAGVRVNIVAPGSVETAMTAGMREPDFTYDESVRKRTGGLEGRAARPEEIAALIAFLASDDASYINGSVVRADGGAFA